MTAQIMPKLRFLTDYSGNCDELDTSREHAMIRHRLGKTKQKRANFKPSKYRTGSEVGGQQKNTMGVITDYFLLKIGRQLSKGRETIGTLGCVLPAAAGATAWKGQQYQQKWCDDQKLIKSIFLLLPLAL